MCGICCKGVSWKKNLTTRMRMHSGERPYQFTICCNVFSEKNTLTVHTRIHSRETPFIQAYVCSIWSKGFSQFIHSRETSTKPPHVMHFTNQKIYTIKKWETSAWLSCTEATSCITKIYLMITGLSIATYMYFFVLWTSFKRPVTKLIEIISVLWNVTIERPVLMMHHLCYSRVSYINITW
jgi:hypothetical protein